MNLFLLLAQAEDVLKTAGKTLDGLERIQAGGIPLICLVIATITTIGFIWQLRRNNAIEKGWREAQKVDSDTNLGQQKELMREMLVRDRDALEAQNACAVALSGVTDTMKDIAAGDASMMALLRGMETLSRTMEALLRAGEARAVALEAQLHATSTRTVEIERKTAEVLNEMVRGPRRST